MRTSDYTYRLSINDSAYQDFSWPLFEAALNEPYNRVQVVIIDNTLITAANLDILDVNSPVIVVQRMTRRWLFRLFDAQGAAQGEFSASLFDNLAFQLGFAVAQLLTLIRAGIVLRNIRPTIGTIEANE